MPANAPLEPLTPVQKKLARASAWLPADLEQVLKERKSDGLAFLASIAESRDIVGSPKAYSLLSNLLFRFVENRPKDDVTPLVPLLQRICSFEGYDPGGTRQYESVRNAAVRILARRGDPAARAVIDRFVADFPERRDRTYAVSLVEVFANAACDLGAPELERPLRALLDTMILEYKPAQRRAELAQAESALRRLAKAKKNQP